MTDDEHDEQDDEDDDCAWMYYTLGKFVNFALKLIPRSKLIKGRLHLTSNTMQAIGDNLKQLGIDGQREGVRVIRELADAIEEEIQVQERFGKEMSRLQRNIEREERP